MPADMAAVCPGEFPAEADQTEARSRADSALSLLQVPSVLPSSTMMISQDWGSLNWYFAQLGA